MDHQLEGMEIEEIIKRSVEYYLRIATMKDCCADSIEYFKKKAVNIVSETFDGESVSPEVASAINRIKLNLMNIPSVVDK